MKSAAFVMSIVALVVAFLGAAYLAMAGEVRMTNYRFSDSTLRGPGAYALALGIAVAGAVPFFGSCMVMWPRRRAKFELLRNVSLVVAGAALAMAVIGGYMARGGVSAI